MTHVWFLGEEYFTVGSGFFWSLGLRVWGGGCRASAWFLGEENFTCERRQPPAWQ